MAWTFTASILRSGTGFGVSLEEMFRYARAGTNSSSNSLKQVFWTLYYNPRAGYSVQKTIGMCCTKIVGTETNYENQGSTSTPPASIVIQRESTIIAGSSLHNTGSSRYYRTIPAFTLNNPNHGSYDLLANTYIVSDQTTPFVNCTSGTWTLYFNVPDNFVIGQRIGTSKQGGYTCGYFNLSGLLTIMIPNSSGGGWTSWQETQGSYIKSGTDVSPTFKFSSYPGTSTNSGVVISSSLITTLYQGKSCYIS